MSITVKKDAVLSFSRKHALSLIHRILRKLEMLRAGIEFDEQHVSYLQVLDYLKSHSQAELKKIAFDLQSYEQEKQSLNLGLLYVENLLSVSVVDGDFLVTTSDQVTENRDTFPCVVILDNIRSAFNVGSVIRTAEAFGAECVYLCGYTPKADHPKVAKAALSAEEWVSIQYRESVFSVIEDLKSQGYTIYALETSQRAESLWSVSLKTPVAFLFGNEKFGLSEAVLPHADGILSIPMAGRKNSVNVGVCAGMVLYEARGQWNQKK